jgi:CRP-like cAMP-binding protein
MQKLCEVISKTILFKGLEHDVFSQYCSKTSIRVAWKGEIIENEGDDCNGIGVLLQGKLALQKYASTGEFSTISLIEEGEMYGEDLLFGTTNQFPMTIEAVTNSKILYIPKSVLIPLMQNNHFLNQNFIKILSDKVRSQNERISLLSQKTLRQKIAFYLLELYKKTLKEKSQIQLAGIHIKSVNTTGSNNKKAISNPPEDLVIELPVSKEVIAKLLAMPRPSFSRELINMEKDGFIKVDGRNIRIMNLQELESGALEGDGD